MVSCLSTLLTTLTLTFFHDVGYIEMSNNVTLNFLVLQGISLKLYNKTLMTNVGINVGLESLSQTNL